MSGDLYELREGVRITSKEEEGKVWKGWRKDRAGREKVKESQGAEEMTSVCVVCG